MDHQTKIEPGGAWWTASSADIDALADRFRRTRRRRLVILGGAGMGKTTLAVQLLLYLLKTRIPDEPVPVLVPVAGWDTEQFPLLRDWLADQLAHTYPALRSPDLGVDLMRALTGRGHILPVLDGLDELPPPARAKVITALNSSLGEGQLVLTSRTAEFAAAVTRAGDVVTSAAVLEPLPLSPAAAADYLTLWLPPSPGSGWQQVLAELRAAPPVDQAPPGGPGAVLAEVAATPLGLWLLRSVYSTPGADPAELADPDRFPRPEAMRAHLFDRLIPAQIAARPPSEDPADPFRPRRRHDPDRVRRYLGNLADHLHHIPTDDDQTTTRDFAWWQLALHTLNPNALNLTLALVLGPAVGLGIGLVGGLVGALVNGWEGLGHGLRIGLELGIGFGFVLGLRGLVRRPVRRLLGKPAGPSWLTQAPGFAKLARHPIPLSPLLKRGLVVGLVGVLVGVLVGWLVGGLVNVVAGGILGGLLGMLVGGFVFVLGLVGGLVQWVESPAPEDQPSTPLSTWRADRSLNLLRTLAGGLVFGSAGVLVGVLVGVLAGGLKRWLEYGLVDGLDYGFLIGLVAGRHHAWLMYLVATRRLARRRLLPRRLMPFLDDMHRLGLLRAVGPIYQFRHAELQDHLAAAYRSNGRPKDQRKRRGDGYEQPIRTQRQEGGDEGKSGEPVHAVRARAGVRIAWSPRPGRC